MILYLQIQGDDEAKSRSTYHCSVCGAHISDAAAAVKINGSDEHSFVNPVGVRCNFYTFLDCTNILEHRDLHEEHSWFPGYGWRFLVCAVCLHHLGWKYDALRSGMRPEAFFGVLMDAVNVVRKSD
jgi:hypothetical protein